MGIIKIISIPWAVTYVPERNGSTVKTLKTAATLAFLSESHILVKNSIYA